MYSEEEMNGLFQRFNSLLDGMIDDLNQKMAKRESEIEESLKDDPKMLLKYKSAMFHVDEWINEHPMQCPPDPEYFLRFLK